jgi:putative transposase
VVTAAQQRAAADYLREIYRISQRRASRVLGRARSTIRYRRRQRSGEDALIKAIRRLARRHPRYGYKRIHARLKAQGWRVNSKRVRRLWNELGLRRAPRRKKPRRSALPGSSANSCVKQPARFKNDVWTCDFIVDRTADGGSLKWLSLVDEYTRECLALQVGSSMTGAEVRRVLAREIGRR